MKKSFVLLFLAVTSLLGLAMTSNKANAAAAGQVVFHYQKWDGVYTNAGLWVWGTGTGGQVDGISQTGVDDFGAYFTITIGDDATSMGIIPISDEFGTDNRWNHKDSKGGMDLALDVTAAAGGATMHVYFVSGSDTIFVGDPDDVNVLVVFFTATEVYEENLGLHAWGTWDVTDEAMAALGPWSTWGTPTEIFTGSFFTPSGKLGRVGMIKAIPGGANPNLIIYAGTDATKKTGDVAVNIQGLVAGDVAGVYASSAVYQGFENVVTFSDASFQFKFIDFANKSGVFSGTYASKKNTILVKFSSEVDTAFYDELGTPIITTYEKYEITGYEYIPTGSGGVVIDTTVYDPYVAAPIPVGMEGRVVFHYQKWDSDYSDVGLWTWGTGTGGSSAPVVRSGVDSFGAVMEINIGTGADDSIGIIPIADQIGADTRWDYRETPDGQQIMFDITAIKNGTVEQIDIYYFQGGFQTYYTANPAKVNVITLYMNNTGTYTATTGIHNWGWDVNAAGWGEPMPMAQAFKSPDGVPGIAAMVTADPAAAVGGGIIVHDGDTKFSGNDNVAGIFGTAEVPMAAGSVVVVYSGIAGATEGTYGYTLDKDAFVLELMVETERVAVYGYVQYEQIDYPRVEIDLLPFFTLLKDGVEVTDAFLSLDYNAAKDSLTELVVVLNDDLDNTAVYTLVFNNGATGIDAKVTELDINLDTVAPEIIFIGDDTVTITAGDGWDSALWPDVEATDDRDGNVTDRIYVKPTEGTLDTNTPGTYPIKLTVYDTWGNETQATFTIIVEAAPVESGCAAASASIAFTSLLGIVLFFIRRKDWAL